jgi:predicted CopG family antitoxin
MQKKLTITVDEQVYDGLRQIIGPRKISRFIQELVRPYVLQNELESQYFQMSMDEEREKEALNWSETLLSDYDA